MRFAIGAFFVLGCFANIHADSLYVSPSAYYTHGEYTNGAFLNMASFFFTHQIPGNHFITAGYDNMKINGAKYGYRQWSGKANARIDFSPMLFSFNYSYVHGDYSAKQIAYTYNDNTNIYNPELSYTTGSYNLGVSLTHINFSGITGGGKIKRLVVDHSGLKLQKTFAAGWTVTLRPDYTSLDDGRSLYSVLAKVNYKTALDLAGGAPTPVVFRCGAMLGKRCYFFDPDNLSLYNQYETQRLQLLADASIYFYHGYSLNLMYQYNRFMAYSISYYTLGIKAELFE
jgi:hypothetical protein